MSSSWNNEQATFQIELPVQRVLFGGFLKAGLNFFYVFAGRAVSFTESVCVPKS